MHYLDHAATTPVLPEVKEAMLPFLEEDFGNPSSVHGFGRRAKEAVETARERVAAAIGAGPSEIFFTGGGTEANNLGLIGAVRKRRGNGNHISISAFEHHAVLDTAEWLAESGLAVSHIGVGEDGIVTPAAAAKTVKSSTLLVAVMAVNNEIGTIQPVAQIAASVKEVNRNTVVHTDAVQALGNIPVDVRAWGVDLAAFAAHKLGGPKGVGALYVRAGTPVEALVHGGGQERGLRSGTLNVAGIAGFGVAAELAVAELEAKAERVRQLRDRLLEGIRVAIGDVRVNGSLEHRVPGNLNISIPHTEGETLILLLDRAGVAASSGSACASGAIDPSHVLSAIGIPKDVAIGSLRLSLGRSSTEEDVDAVLRELPAIVVAARRAA
ncbi:MAG: cysteine desulfurase family protein [Actinomycetota bacterium]